MNSFLLVTPTSGNLPPPAEGLGALSLRFPIIHLESERYGVFVVVEHCLFVVICSSLVLARSKVVCDFIAPPRTRPFESPLQPHRASGVLLGCKLKVTLMRLAMRVILELMTKFHTLSV
ncbi:hypothetical protein RF11_11065 [Thelohanellus kitauei]|uniref:Uncharacterized protein n=1 Tax=Thelohanellus kitauei TaxID=669202 RepID=A0A0C2MQ76_THEKT|nr:hypothetical protein RF11_11065 [Thelohanellus kitauei]